MADDRMADDRLAALIPAAGLSSRMGDFKPLLQLRGKTIIEHAIGVFQDPSLAGAVSEIMVVTGFRSELLLPVIRKCGVSWQFNEIYERGMFSSIQAGARSLQGRCGAFFVLPADHPLIGPATVCSLIRAYRGDREKIYRPSHGGRFGHPPLIPAELIPFILGFEEGGGLRALLNRHINRTVRVECDDPGIMVDLDTRRQFDALTGE